MISLKGTDESLRKIEIQKVGSVFAIYKSEIIWGRQPSLKNSVVSKN